MSVKDEINKVAKAVAGLVSSGQLYMVGEADNHSHRIINWAEEIAAAESEVCLVVDNEVKYLQLLDLVHSTSAFVYCNRLQKVYEYVGAGNDVDRLIELLFQDIRYDENQMDASISSTITILDLLKHIPRELNI